MSVVRLETSQNLCLWRSFTLVYCNLCGISTMFSMLSLIICMTWLLIVSNLLNFYRRRGLSLLYHKLHMQLPCSQATGAIFFFLVLLKLPIFFLSGMDSFLLDIFFSLLISMLGICTSPFPSIEINNSGIVHGQISYHLGNPWQSYYDFLILALPSLAKPMQVLVFSYCTAVFISSRKLIVLCSYTSCFRLPSYLSKIDYSLFSQMFQYLLIYLSLYK